MRERRPAPVTVERKPTDLIVTGKLTGVERAFAQLSLLGSLGHQKPPLAPPDGGQEKRASPRWSALGWSGENRSRRRAQRPSGLPGGSSPEAGPDPKTRGDNTLSAINSVQRETRADDSARSGFGRGIALSNRPTRMI